MAGDARPKISYVIHMFSKFMHTTREYHLQESHYVFRYIQRPRYVHTRKIYIDAYIFGLFIDHRSIKGC